MLPHIASGKPWPQRPECEGCSNLPRCHHCNHTCWSAPAHNWIEDELNVSKLVSKFDHVAVAEAEQVTPTFHPYGVVVAGDPGPRGVIQYPDKP